MALLVQDDDTAIIQTDRARHVSEDVLERTVERADAHERRLGQRQVRFTGRRALDNLLGPEGRSHESCQSEHRNHQSLSSGFSRHTAAMPGSVGETASHVGSIRGVTIRMSTGSSAERRVDPNTTR